MNGEDCPRCNGSGSIYRQAPLNPLDDTVSLFEDIAERDGTWRLRGEFIDALARYYTGELEVFEVVEQLACALAAHGREVTP